MNASSNFPDEDKEKNTAEHFTTDEIITGSVILSLVILLGIIGNLLTCLIIYKKSSFRTATNISVLFLSISDISMATLVMPFSLASLIKGEGLFSAEGCTFNAFLICFLFGASFITMTCTALIRYLCVVKPSLHHQYVKPKIVASGIAFLWLINFFLQVFLLSVSNGRGIYSRKQIFCLYYSREKGPLRGAINKSGLAIAVVLGLLIFMAYFKVFRFVSHHNNTVASNLQQRNISQLQEVKITKTLVTVLLGFAACWAPFITIHFLHMLERHQYLHFRLPMLVFLFQTICIFVSNFINPFIYAVSNKRFRKEYFKLLSSLKPSSTQITPIEIL